MGSTFRKFRLLSAALIVTAAMCAQAQSSRNAASDELDIAIRDASDYLNGNIPRGSKIVILNIESVSANLSEYIIDELIANAVNDKMFSVVDRRQLETIRAEQKFQMSGAVDDKDALAIGKLFGAQTIISGTMRNIGGRFRLTIRALAVQTAQVQGQYNRNMPISQTLAGLANSGGGSSASGATTYGASSTPTYGGAASSAPAGSSPASIQGTRAQGNNLADKLAWLKRTADSHNTYVVEVTADEKIAPHTFRYEGAINITIVLVGVGGNRTIRLQSNGMMFKVPTNITLILGNNITLQGHNGNNDNIINVEGGTLKMNNGSAIIGNVGSGGVYVRSGSFEMTGGTISGNGRITNFNGGGVDVRGTFTMSGGTISGNMANDGGGVYVGGTFIMKGGIITGNTAGKNGGGVSCGGFGISFNKTGGTITGYNSDPNNGNVVKDEGGDILARRGHAVWVGSDRRKETTSGPNSSISYGGSKGTTGDWDN